MVSQTHHRKIKTSINTGYQMLPLITGFFVAVLLISNIASTKVVSIWWFTFDGGTLLFPLTYIFSDVFTEVYVFRIARRTIWIGMACQVMAVSFLLIVGILPAPAEWTSGEAYNAILMTTFRIVIASNIAYFFGSWSNDVVMSVMKRVMMGRKLWMRTIGSTLIGEGVDTILFCLIAFAGVFSPALLLTIIISNYIFKCGVEILATPLTYLICRRIKNIEGLDTIDDKINYTPFSWKITGKSVTK